MARIFITGSSQGLGLMAGALLASRGHAVVLHARDEARADAARQALPSASAVLVGDVSTIAAMFDLAAAADASGRFDAVIHNVGLGYRAPCRSETADGLSQLWAVNVLAPYVLTAAMHRPDRLVYLSSGLSRSGRSDLRDLQWADRPWDGTQAYSDTKLHDLLLTFGVARRWRGVSCNAVEPGWVATRMGGPHATDDLPQGHLTQVWLATGDDAAARGTAGYFYHRAAAAVHPDARRADLQDRLLDACASVSGVGLGTG